MRGVYWETNTARCSKSSIQNDIYIYIYNLYIYVADVAGIYHIIAA